MLRFDLLKSVGEGFNEFRKMDSSIPTLRKIAKDGDIARLEKFGSQFKGFFIAFLRHFSFSVYGYWK